MTPGDITGDARSMLQLIRQISFLIPRKKSLSTLVAKLLKQTYTIDICTKLHSKRALTACVQAQAPTLTPGTEFYRAGQVLQANVHLVLEGGTGATCQR